jgi:hypothetical protein
VLVVEVALAMGQVAAVAIAIVANAFNSDDPNYIYLSCKLMPENMPKGNQLEIFSTFSVHCLILPPLPTNEPQKLNFIKSLMVHSHLMLS